MEFEEKTLSRREIYKGPIFQLVQDQVELPNGKGTAQRDLIFHNGAVCVLAVTPENKIVLVKQYRKAIEKVSYEFLLENLELAKMQIQKQQLFVNWKKKLPTLEN